MEEEELVSRVRLEGADHDVHVHLTPVAGPDNVRLTWGGAIAMALLSLVTHKLPQPDVAVGSPFATCDGVLVNRMLTDNKDREEAFRLAKDVGSLNRVVLNPTVANMCRSEGEKVGLEVVRLVYLFEAIEVVFSLTS